MPTTCPELDDDELEELLELELLLELLSDELDDVDTGVLLVSDVGEVRMMVVVVVFEVLVFEVTDVVETTVGVVLCVPDPVELELLFSTDSDVELLVVLVLTVVEDVCVPWFVMTT